MQIRRIKVKNFKSFKEIDITPSNFNVLIGPNASGKSNFLSIFRFVRDIINMGLSNAISLQGGMDYLRNLHLGDNNKRTSIRIEIDSFSKIRGMKKIGDKMIRIRSLSFETDFEIEAVDGKEEFQVVHDTLIQKFEFYEMDKGEDVSIGTGVLEMYHDHDRIKSNFINNTSCNITKNDIIPTLFVVVNSVYTNLRKTLFIENQYNMPHPESVRKALGELCIYDLDPIQSRSVSSIAGRAELEENGENIAIILRKILADDESRRRLFNYIHYVLPFVEDIKVEKFLDKHLQVQIKEKYSPNVLIPASLMSSGSIFLVSIIIALFFEKKDIAIFEEPGGRVHPYLISRIIEMMKDVTSHKQIFLTTHNPEIVKYAGLDSIFYLTRTTEGFSTIAHISNRKEIYEFMKNEIGIEELYIQNLLS